MEVTLHNMGRDESRNRFCKLVFLTTTNPAKQTTTSERLNDKSNVGHKFTGLCTRNCIIVIYICTAYTTKNPQL